MVVRASVDGGPPTDPGSIVLVMALVLVVAGTLAHAVADLGVAMAERRRAQSAADASALAAVVGGRSAAARVAARNGAALVVVQLTTGAEGATTATVEVAVGDARARARATDGP